MTMVAAIFVPLVLAYQGWSYWAFRQRLVRPASQPKRAPRVAAAGRRPEKIPAGFFLRRRGWGPCSAP